jgi:hypothetical protein
MSALASKSSTPTQSPPPEKVDLSGNKIVKFNNGWTKEQEELMAGWADIGACYRWMHDKYEKKASASNMWITVPVIVLSTLTGSASFIMNSVLGDNMNAQKYAQIGIGGVSIFTGILTTLGNFFRYAQSSEANRVASLSWGKFQRQIAIELALHPTDRLDSMDFLKICRAELDRLIEQSPPIPDEIITAFEKEFCNTPRLKKPDIAHGIDHTDIFKDTNSNIKKLIVDATIMLKQKKKVWHEAMMPDVNKHLDTRIERELTDLSKNFKTALEEKIRVLEEKMAEKEKAGPRAAFRTSIRGTAGVRLRNTPATPVNVPAPGPGIHIPEIELNNLSVNTTLPGSAVVSPAQLISALSEKPIVTVVVEGGEGEEREETEYSKKT